jgi:Zn-dependent membrane protease YugP
MMWFFDPIYLLFLLPGILLAAWAQWKVHSAFASASRFKPRSGLAGAEAADAILHANSVDGVRIQPVHGHLADHYDPTARTLRLSSDVYGVRSLAAVGVAAHEAGHAIQHARGYSLLSLRNALVPLASFGSQAAWGIFFLGLILASFEWTSIGRIFVYVGIGAFALTVLFQLVNLPVEFDASRRARIALQETGIVTPEEDREVGRVLNAAALTYVAATLTGVLTLLYFLFRSGLLGRRSDD